MKKLTKGIEEAKKEKEKLVEEKEKLRSTFKEIEQKAFIVQENYKKTQQVFVALLIFLIKMFYKTRISPTDRWFLLRSSTAD